MRFNPLAVLFRDVLSDDEVSTIQQLASPKLARATVQNSQTGLLETASYRIRYVNQQARACQLEQRHST
jgi:prolyl 4-hydroxylase